MKRSFAALIATMTVGCTMLYGVTPEVSPLQVESGRLESFEVYSPQLERPVTVDVWLPEGYDPGKRYPVVYMHDGQMLHDASTTWNHQAWEVDSVVGSLISDGLIEAPIVVGPYNVSESRISDYMPTEVVEMIDVPMAREALAQWMPQGARGADYVDFLAETLKPVVDSLYSTRTDAGSTVTMGSSMGGLISLYAICRRPDVFGGAGCLSTHLTGTVGHNEIFPSALMGYVVSHLPSREDHKIYFDNGDQDLDWNYLPYFPRIVSLFRESGYDSNHLMDYLDEGQGHNERAWGGRLSKPFIFFFGREAETGSDN